MGGASTGKMLEHRTKDPGRQALEPAGARCARFTAEQAKCEASLSLVRIPDARAWAVSCEA